MREAVVATMWFVLAGTLCAITVGSWDTSAPPDVRFVAFMAIWAVAGVLPPAFYKLMREWFR